MTSDLDRIEADAKAEYYDDSSAILALCAELRRVREQVDAIVAARRDVLAHSAAHEGDGVLCACEWSGRAEDAFDEALEAALATGGAPEDTDA